MDVAISEVPADMLRRCMNDLVGLVALPAMWTGAPPAEVGRTFTDVLVRVVELDLVYLRLNAAPGAEPIELIGGRAEVSSPPAARARLESELGDDAGKWPARSRSGELGSVVTIRLGIHGELGVLVVAAGRP